MYKPSIKNYKPFYIQGEGSAIDILDTYGIVAMTNPYKVPSVKEPYSQEWFDEDGKDVYIPSVQVYNSIELEVRFYCKTYTENGVSCVDSLKSQVSSFRELVSKGWLRVVDQYTGIGFRRVRYVETSEEEYKHMDDWARLMFTMKFEVEDLRTGMVLSGTSINARNNAVCSTSAGTKAKNITISGYTPSPMDVISVKFNNGNTNTAPTLSVNGGAAKNVKGLTGIASGVYYALRYDGTEWNNLGLI